MSRRPFPPGREQLPPGKAVICHATKIHSLLCEPWPFLLLFTEPRGGGPRAVKKADLQVLLVPVIAFFPWQEWCFPSKEEEGETSSGISYLN